MGIFSELKDSFSRTRVLASASFGVLKSDRSLMAFPALSMAAAALILVVNWALVYLATAGLNIGTVDEPGRWATEPIVWLGLIASILLISFTSIYFTAALTYGAWERFRGNTPTFEGCLSAANARLHVIIPWALLAGTVGVIIEVLYRLPSIFRHMQEAGRHIPVVGQFAALGAMIVAIALETVWYFITYLVVPVLVVEETGPVTSCKRSFRLFRKTWGKSLIAQIGFDLIGFLLIIPGLMVAALIVVIGLGNPVALVLGIAVGVAWLLVVMAAMAAVVGIFKMALYLYVTTGEVPGEFQGTGLEKAFASKKELKAERKAKRQAKREQRRAWRDGVPQPSAQAPSMDR